MQSSAILVSGFFRNCTKRDTDLMKVETLTRIKMAIPASQHMLRDACACLKNCECRASAGSQSFVLTYRKRTPCSKTMVLIAVYHQSVAASVVVVLRGGRLKSNGTWSLHEIPPKVHSVSTRVRGDSPNNLQEARLGGAVCCIRLQYVYAQGLE